MRPIAALMLATTGLLAGAATADDGVSVADEKPAVLDIPANGHMTIAVDGHSLDGFSGPGMPSVLALRRSTALDLFGPAIEDRQDRATAGFELFSFARTGDAKVGPVLVHGYRRSAAIAIGPFGAERAITWSHTDVHPFAAAMGGPYALPAPVVRYALRVPAGGEQVVSLTLERQDGWVASTARRTGNKPLRFAFAPQFATTVVSAASGSAIAAEFGGEYTGPARPVLISYGVERPARPMRLGRPLRLGPIVIDSVLVRTSDYGSATGIGELPPDPAETAGDDGIVVQGRRRGTRPSYIVYVGADALRGCASIVYDKPAHRIDLNCRPVQGRAGV